MRFDKFSNLLAWKMLQKKQLNLDVCPQTVIRQKFPKAIPQFESCYHQSAKMNIYPTNIFQEPDHHLVGQIYPTNIFQEPDHHLVGQLLPQLQEHVDDLVPRR